MQRKPIGGEKCCYQQLFSKMAKWGQNLSQFRDFYPSPEKIPILKYMHILKPSW
jgi:hypothetical protein